MSQVLNQDVVLDARLQSAKDLASWLYIFHGLSLVFSLGMFSWLPLILNYLKRDEAAGTFVYSHHRWQIRSFWWYLFALFIAGLLCLTVIGIPLALMLGALAWIWKAYRLLKGWFDLGNNKPMPI